MIESLTAHAPILIVVVPMLNALLCPVLGFFSGRAPRWTTRIATGASLGFSLLGLVESLSPPELDYYLGGWQPPWGIEIVIDPLSGVIATLVSGVAFLASFYSGPFVGSWSERRTGVFEAVYSLLVTGLLGIVVTGDLFNLYVFLEISSLSAYALLSMGGSRAVVAAFRYLLVGTVAASFYLIGVGYLYAVTGTLNMADMASRLPSPGDTPAVIVGASFIVIGLAIKAALFPLHGWLPDAYTFAPGSIIGFIAAVMSKVSAYALYRILYFVFSADDAPGQLLFLLEWASVLAIVAGSLVAVAQKDVQRMLAYSSVGQMGYIILGISIGTPLALTGAVLHVVSHAAMKGCLIMAVNGVQWRLGVFRVRDFAGMGRRLPFTMAAFTIASLSMIGLPPTAGFFSKYYLMLAALEEGHVPFLIALILSSLLGAVYLFRVIEQAYLNEPKDPVPGSTELPAGMLVPILTLAAAVLAVGIFNQAIVATLLVPGLPS